MSKESVRTRNGMFTALIGGSAILIQVFLNCSGISASNLKTAASGNVGNDNAGFDGKVFVSRLPHGKCPDGSEWASRIEFNGRGEALLKRSACQEIPPETVTPSVEFTPNNLRNLVFKSMVFDLFETGIMTTDFYCRQKYPDYFEEGLLEIVVDAAIRTSDPLSPIGEATFTSGIFNDDKVLTQDTLRRRMTGNSIQVSFAVPDPLTNPEAGRPNPMDSGRPYRIEIKGTDSANGRANFNILLSAPRIFGDTIGVMLFIYDWEKYEKWQKKNDDLRASGLPEDETPAIDELGHAWVNVRCYGSRLYSRLPFLSL